MANDEQPPPVTPLSAGVDRVEVEREPGVKGRDEQRYDPNFLWRVYVQCGGITRRMLDLDDPGIPKSVRTIQQYARRYRWKEKLSAELNKQHIEQVPNQADASKKRLERMRVMEDALFNLLTPKTLPSGEVEWALPPTKFESTLDKFLKLLDRIEVMSGGVSSRTEVKKVIQVNVNIVCAVFGRVLNELSREGALSLKTARTINDRFFERIGRQQIQLSTEPVKGGAFSVVESEGEDS